MSKHDLITKDFALYVVHYFASMETWSKKDILAEIDRKIKEADEDVVRCKECKYWEKAPLFYEGAMICMRSSDYVTATNEMDFCSYGERKEP
jgi:hypothetical protein